MPCWKCALRCAMIASLATVGSSTGFPWHSSNLALAEEITLSDGRVLSGQMANLNSVAANPLDETKKKSTDPVGIESIRLIDNDLTRVFVPKRMIQSIDQGGAPLIEIKIPHNQLQVARIGKRVVSVGALTVKSDFDNFGRRTITIATSDGPKDVIQGITSITPVWTRIEGLNTHLAGQYQCDMRISTGSLSRETLTAILNQLNANGKATVDQRLQVVKLFLQSERYKDAMAELELVLHDFPNVAALVSEVGSIRKLYAKRILKEVEARRNACQHDLARRMLEQFPADGMPGEILAEVHGELQRTLELQNESKSLCLQLDGLMKQAVDRGLVAKVTQIRNEMNTDLSFNNIARLAAFKRLADDPNLSADEKVSLAITGWLLGADDAVTDVKACVSLIEVRDQVREFLNETVKLNRDQLLQKMARGQPYSTPLMVAKLLSHMKPPVVTEAQESPGFFQLSVNGPPGQPPVTYFVQLPPEYDPYHAYPAIVTLHAGWTTPQQQVDWWAGPETKDGRAGQAMRQGYIVIAPAWGSDHQKRYEYSTREHNAVLSSLRDACRRFSIDTDRVYLSGHSMGGDAAWDIGLAHPDLWAGVMPILATSDKFVPFEKNNARYLPLYFLCGELDGRRMLDNATTLDSYYIMSGCDVTVTEYIGRGHENLSDDILQLFDWMDRKRRNFSPTEVQVSTMRPSDNFFWWVETRNMPARTMADGANWPPAAGTRAMQIKARVAKNENITVTAPGSDVTVWLTPELADFERGKSIAVTINGKQLGRKGQIQPDLHVLLDDVRTRGDRQHPFWAKIE